MFFVKKFPDSQEWEQWTKRFKEFSLKILDREGKTKKQIKADPPLVQATTSKRICSKCKQEGHNSATCRNFHRKQATEQVFVPSVAIDVKKGNRICSICKEKGHNARTCKNNRLSQISKKSE